MRSARAALTLSYSRPNIPYDFIGNDGVRRTVDDLECAKSVMADFGVIPIDGMPTATAIWNRAVGKHGPGETPPLGAPLCFPNLTPGKSGHIALYAGQGRAYTTPVWLRDADRRTDKYLISIADLAAQCGNAYAGWISDFAGQGIDFSSTAGDGTTPFPNNQEDTMRLIRDTKSGGIYFVTDNGLAHIPNASDLNVMVTFLRDSATPGKILDMLPADVLTVKKYIAAADNNPDTVVSSAITQKDIDAIALAVDKQLDDEQAAILAAVAGIKAGDVTALTALVRALPAATVAEFKNAL